MKATGNAPRLLYVLGLALMGLSFYIVVLLLLVVGAMSFFSGRAHAQAEPTGTPMEQVATRDIVFVAASQPDFRVHDCAGTRYTSHIPRA